MEMLFLKPSARGKGLGKTLIRYAIENLNCKKVDVNEQNQPAAGFYKRFGFKIVTRSELDGLGKPYPILPLQLDL
nr:GNAT family N-acetyltransferase [Adhaeribacter arboris]